MKIKDLTASERPRERLLAKGPASLSESELLAILIRNGEHGCSAIELGQRLMADAEGKISNIFNAGVDRLCKIPGIGPGKAATIVAALELGRRFIMEEASVVKKPIVTARMAFELIFPALKGLRHEECWVLLLNHHNFFISKSRLTIGAGNMTIIDVKEVLRLALEKGASGVILVHNHPSGSPQPSAADVKQTDALHGALKTCSIDLLDHLIVCDDCFYSFSEEKVRSAF